MRGFAEQAPILCDQTPGCVGSMQERFEGACLSVTLVASSPDAFCLTLTAETSAKITINQCEFPPP